MKDHELSSSGMGTAASVADGEQKIKLGKVKLLLFTAVPLLIFAGLMEIASKAYLKHRFAPFSYSLDVQAGGSMRESSYQVWEHPPNYTSWSRLAHFNNYGLRRNEDTPAAKPAGVHRIFVLGGSAAYGSQPTDTFQKLSGQKEYGVEDTIAGWMERILNAKYPGTKFEVTNAAVNWTKLHQQMLRYLRQLKDFEPDMIVSFDGWNDSSLRPYPRFLNGWDLTEYGYQQDVSSLMQYRARSLIRLSHTAYLTAMFAFQYHDWNVDQALVAKYQRQQPPSDYDRKVEALYAEQRIHLDHRVDEYVRTLRYFHDILTIDRVPHLFALQPMLILDQTKPLTDREKAIRGYLYSSVDNATLWRQNFYGRVVSEGNRLRQEQQMPFYPMLDPFRGMTADAYTDYCHLTPAGNKAIAERIIERLEADQPQLFHLQTAAAN